jgi:adenylate cyclase
MEKDQLSRKLAVILHADVVGSTSLVQQNETLAHERIHTAFNSFSETIGAYGGIAREIRGDALVAEFDRASDAVAAALAFQIINGEFNSTLNDDIQPQLRIGISLGEVIIADNTITGAGVVLAQRLEQLAEPGGVVVQGSVSETVPSRMPFEFDGLGEQMVKGFDQPVRAFIATLKSGEKPPALEEVVSASEATPSSPQIPDEPSIAVLPFTNMSGDSEQDYFSDGISEDLITELSHFSDLFVIARNSSFQYRGDAIDIKQVGRELGVRYVLEGSVRKGGDRVRITVQLIDSLNGNHIWAERYDRILDDVFALQDEIVRQVVSTVASQVNATEFARNKDRPTNSLSAYDNYLRGMHSDYYHGSVDNFSLAREYYEQAVSIDPEYADALAQLANINIVLDYLGDTSASLEKAIDYAERAVKADNRCATAHGALGSCLLDMGNHNRAEHHFEQALKINPNNTRILGWYCLFLGVTGQTDNAVSIVESAIRRDPLHPEWLHDILGEVCWIGGRYQDAISAYAKLRVFPFWVHGILAPCYAYLDRDEEAQVHAKAFKNGLPVGATIESETEYWMMRLKNEPDKSKFLEGWRKSGIID